VTAISTQALKRTVYLHIVESEISCQIRNSELKPKQELEQEPLQNISGVGAAVKKQEPKPQKNTGSPAGT